MPTRNTRRRRKLQVILDSNALFVPSQFKIDIFEALNSLLNTKFEPILLSPILREIERLSVEASPKIRKHALFALTLAEKCKLVTINESKETPPDDVIISFSRQCGCPVFTNDRRLRKKLRDINVPVIYVRQKSRLQIDGRL
jgi:rRNA-processing protein FCF1